jgi:N-methylhydantoinase B/oxoprolinase/acetone carboxylase alpha subunit
MWKYSAPRRGSGFCPNEEMHAGERLLLRSAGGGGYGEPGVRDRVALARDVAEGYVSQDSARKDYGNT